jgi:hypothetical protein
MSDTRYMSIAMQENMANIWTSYLTDVTWASLTVEHFYNPKILKY